ncbi:copper amine oxidase N-terminal domain-containing protein [Paenibacillus methanolicus]|uniref:Copper amine oxidase-like protein n=1 Tax=Paenibacillus methanolicus TaxID=582686 RepID=A0A5S5BYH3_9BACL|nr:copper amine oxidase N-terminal domain-containing protein [Paenibacillus methanolicus]TYP72087.1 copper amine oxidase-like protein [Paenibacillus methanolicus]
MNKKAILLVISTLMLLATVTPVRAASTGKAITPIVDGKVVQSDVDPIIEKGRVLVPLRALASLDLEFLWDGTNKIATVKNKEGKYAMLRLREKMARVNGQEVKLDAPLTVVKGRVLVPLRFIGEAFGFQVNYEAERSAVIISNSATEQQEEAFSSGVFIDWKSGDDPLLNEVIIENLKTALASMAEKDIDTFKSVFINSTTPSAFIYLLENEYRFEALGTVMDDRSGRIEITIIGKVKTSDGIVNETNLAFYYMKDKQGEWKLASID